MKDILALRAALRRATNLIHEGYWIHIEFPHPQGVVLDYGALLSNGEKEQAIGTITFVSTARGVIASECVHP